MALFEERITVRAMNQAHLALVVLVDTSSSISAACARHIENEVKRLKEHICKDETARKCVDVCVIGFDDEPRVLQDWCAACDMGPVDVVPRGRTDLDGAVLLAARKERQILDVYRANGIEAKKTHYMLLTDGDDTVTGNVDQSAELVTRRIRENKVKLFFLGFGSYDRATAAQLTAGNGSWCFEVGEGDVNFSDFFDFVAASVKAASVGAPGEDVRVNTNIGAAENPSNVKVVDLNDWLNGRYAA